VALDALIEQRSVTGAARTLRLSTSAMSRTLGRLREALNDPILVPAGRVMVPTAHAETIAQQVHLLNREVHGVLGPARPVALEQLNRQFNIRANEAFVVSQAARLAEAVARQAPNVRLRFAPKPDRDSTALRDGSIDLDIGAKPGEGAELRVQALFRDRFVGVARAGHPLLGGALPVTAEEFAATGQVVAAWSDRFEGPIDEALAAVGLQREVRVVVPSFPAVLAVAADSDLVGVVPRSFCEPRLVPAIAMFELPVATPPIVVSQMWHPRLDADPAHRWLRGVVFGAFRTAPTDAAEARVAGQETEGG